MVVSMSFFQKLFGRKPPPTTLRPDPNDRFSHAVVIRIDSSQLQHADLEIPWELERKLMAEGLEFGHDGYGFAAHSDAMFLTLATSQPDVLIARLIDIFENEVVCGDRLAPAAQIAVSERKTVTVGSEYADDVIVYPADKKGGKLED
jgi:hypothetical protein